MNELVWFVPIDEFLIRLCQGWRLSPATLGHHGRYSVLVYREVPDA
jgi:hypothetical protein